MLLVGMMRDHLWTVRLMPFLPDSEFGVAGLRLEEESAPVVVGFYRAQQSASAVQCFSD